jgi:hypothetical protein
MMHVEQLGDDARIWRAGDVCDASGQYALYVSLTERYDPGDNAAEVTMVKGHRFPPTPTPGLYYRLVDLTQHRHTGPRDVSET